MFKNSKIILGFIPLYCGEPGVFLSVTLVVPYTTAVPFLQHPQLSLPTVHGNRVRRHGDCADTTANWQEWESGATANFRLKRPAPDVIPCVTNDPEIPHTGVNTQTIKEKGTRAYSEQENNGSVF